MSWGAVDRRGDPIPGLLPYTTLFRPRGHADEPVRVQVIPQEERRVPIGRREQARTAVVEQVALVDRLQAERVPLVAERREDSLRSEEPTSELQSHLNPVSRLLLATKN